MQPKKGCFLKCNPKGLQGEKLMKKSCHYCGRIHDKNFDCGKKPKRKNQNTDKDKFRSTKAWQRKREIIKERDKYLCQLCIREKDVRYNYDELEVHHVIPLEEDFEKRLDDENLITLCKKHHELSESGTISREYLLKIIQEQEAGGSPPAF